MTPLLSLRGLVLVLLAMALSPAVAEAGQVRLTVQIQGAGMTTVVEGSIEDGASTVCDQRSNQDERVVQSCDRIRNEEILEAWVWLRATPSSLPSGQWSFVGWSGCAETRVRDGFTECAVHSGATSNTDAFPRATFSDDVAPTVSSISEVFSTSVEKRVSYLFSANEAGQLQCRFGGEANFSNCASGVTKDYTTEGLHSIDVRAFDQSGQLGATTSRTVMVVDTALTGGPSGLVNSRTATFDYSSGAGISYKCSLDGAPFTTCGSGTSKTYSGLGDGSHTFLVYAANGDWFDRIPAKQVWNIDGTPPDTVLNGGVGPAEGSSSTSTGAEFGFGSTEGGSFECSLDSAAFAPCATPRSISGLNPGAHRFRVRAKDSAGNVDPSPAERNWSVVPVDGVITPVTPVIVGPVITVPTDTTAPLAAINSSKGQTLARALSRGLVGSGTSNEAGKLRLDVLRSGKKVATSGNRALAAAGKMKLTAKFTTKAKRALARLRSVKLTLRLTATDAAGNVTVTKKTLTLKR